MIPRLSGRNRSFPPAIENITSLPSRSDAQKIIKRFFNLIEQFSVPGEDPAPETKHSRTRIARKKSVKTAFKKDKGGMKL